MGPKKSDSKKCFMSDWEWNISERYLRGSAVLSVWFLLVAYFALHHVTVDVPHEVAFEFSPGVECRDAWERLKSFQ